MNLFDLFVILLVVLMGFSGWREGLVRGGVKLVGFLVTVIVLSVFAGQIGGFARGLEGIPPRLAVPIVFAGVFIAGSVLFAVLAGALRKVVHLTPLGFVDSGLGTVLGAVKALFIAGIVAIILSFMPAQSSLKAQYEHSRFGSGLTQLVKNTIPAITSAGIRIIKYISPATPGLPDRPSNPEKQKKTNESPEYTI